MDLTVTGGRCRSASSKASIPPNSVPPPASRGQPALRIDLGTGWWFADRAAHRTHSRQGPCKAPSMSSRCRTTQLFGKQSLYLRMRNQILHWDAGSLHWPGCLSTALSLTPPTWSAWHNVEHDIGSCLVQIEPCGVAATELPETKLLDKSVSQSGSDRPANLA